MLKRLFHRRSRDANGKKKQRAKPGNSGETVPKVSNTASCTSAESSGSPSQRSADADVLREGAAVTSPRRISGSGRHGEQVIDNNEGSKLSGRKSGETTPREQDTASLTSTESSRSHPQLDAGPDNHGNVPVTPIPGSATPGEQTTDDSVGSKLVQITKGALDVIEPVLEMSDVFPPLKAVVAVLKLILERIETAEENKKHVRELWERISEILKTLESGPIHAAMGIHCRNLARKLDVIVKKLEPIGGLAEDNSNSLRRKCMQFLKAPDNKALVQDCIHSIDRSVLDYQLALVQESYIMNLAQINHDDLALLDGTKHAVDAAFNAYASNGRSHCFEGTRVDIIDALMAWADTSYAKQVYWLHGHAGSGKSTIAQSFAEKLSSKRQLGASVFCSRDSSDARDLRMIFPTIAVQLARADDPAAGQFRAELLLALRANPNLPYSSLQNQLDKLIIGPAKVSGMKTIVVIDALDECDDKETTSVILSFLADNVHKIPNIRFFITSRPESHIRMGFRLERLEAVTGVMVLHEIGATSVDQDIKRYLRWKLSELTGRSDLSLPRFWPPDTQLDALTKKSGGLFIYASTAARIILDKDNDPEEQLERLLSRLDDFAEEGSLGLDRLYGDILVRAYSDKDERFLQSLRAILGLLVVEGDTLRALSIADILSVKKASTVNTRLRSLHSLLVIPKDPSLPIQFHHKSFPDFLTDPTRCTDKRFQIDRDEHHVSAARRCLELMQRKLKKNICGLERYSTNDSLVPGVRDKCIDEGLKYCCRHWASHLLSDSHRDLHLKDMHDVLDRWLKTKLLQWFEVLGLLQELGRAVEALANMGDWLSATDSQYQPMLALITDSHRFILNHFDEIHGSVVQIYHSFLPFAPERSPLKLCYANSDNVKGEVRVLHGCGKMWDGAMRTIRLPNRARAARYSYDGSMLAIGGDGFSQLFRSTTGEWMADHELDSEGGSVLSVSFSCDNRTLATVLYDTIRLWDISTGSRITELRGGTGTGILSIDFHPLINHLLVAADWSGRVYVYQWGNMNGSRTAFDVADSYGTLCWLSLYGRKCVLVGCKNGRMEMWDVDTHHQVRVFSLPSSESEGRVHAVASSSDGSIVASVLHDNKFVAYNTYTGDVVHFIDNLIDNGSSVVSLVLSSTAPTLAFRSGSRAVNICYYDDRATARIVSLAGHNGPVRSVAFSPNGRFVASASDDSSVRIWEIDIASPAYNNAYVSQEIALRFARFSSDGRLVVYVSGNEMVKVWDPRTGIICAILDRQKRRVWDAIFLSNSKYVVFTDMDENTILWDWQRHKILCSNTTMAKDYGLFQILFPYPHGTTILGFVSIHYRLRKHAVYCWAIDLSETGDTRIVLVARGVVPVCKRETLQITHRGSAVPADLELVLDSEPGKQFSALWRNYAVLGDSPQELHFAETSKKSPLSSTCEPTAALRAPCRQSKDSAWILDDHARRVLWIPFANRGEGRWYGSRLFMVGERERITLVDFSDVDLDDDSSQP